MARGVKGSGPPKAPRSDKKPQVASQGPAAFSKAEPVDLAALPWNQHPDGPLGSVDIDSLKGEALRLYAKRAGVLPRDIANLTEDRLRQNTKLMVQNTFELLTED